MRIAVVADVHGNAPALRAVLAEVDREGVDAIVVAGDLVAGPQPDVVLDMLAQRPEPVHRIRGNGEREAVAAWDGETDDTPAGRAGAWSAARMDRATRDAMAAWPIALSLGDVCFCHGSPRRDDEVLTRATPPDVLADACGDAAEALIVGGHTHQQVVRELPGGRRYVNAGSVGVPYEGRTGAFWLVVEDGEPELRCTDYDVAAAVAELRATGYPDVDELVRESLLAPVDPGWVTAFFEHGAGRGPDPGPPPA